MNRFGPERVDTPRRSIAASQRLKTPSHRPAEHVQARENLQPGNDGPLKPVRDSQADPFGQMIAARLCAFVL